ncbi:methionine/alanine import family NSS transporter small subunit [Halobacillus massiliensis]|nr:methionine/alanine import family NSS transporter small subunit [Halobacillus massiliensis]
MTASAIVMMVIGIVVIWGGLAASIINAVKKSKQS